MSLLFFSLHFKEGGISDRCHKLIGTLLCGTYLFLKTLKNLNAKWGGGRVGGDE